MMKRKTKRIIGDTIVSAIAVAIGLVIIFPLIYAFFGAFKTPSEFLTPKLLPSSFSFLDNFKDALAKGNLMRYTLNSLIIAFFGTVVRMMISIFAAYCFTYYDFKGKNFCFFLIL